MSARSRLAVGIIFFALMFFYLCLRAYLGGVAPQQYSRRGWVAEWRDGRAVVVSVGVSSPATGVVREGDVIDAIWSERPDETPLVMPGSWRKRLRTEAEEWREAATPLVTPGLWRVPPGTPYKLTVSRDGQSLEFSLHTSRVFTNMPTGWPFVYVTLTFLLFLSAGATVFLLKPGDEQAWLLALMLTTPVALFPLNIYVQLPRWMYLTALLTQILSTIFFPAILRFFLVFPERSPLLRRFPNLGRLIYLPYLIFLLPVFTLGRVLTGFQLMPEWREPFLRSAGAYGGELMVAYMLAGLIAMAVNYRAVGATSRRKLRVVMIGSGAGFLNILLMPFGELVGLKRALPGLWGWLDVGLLFTAPLIPLSFAYAIIRHKVIPVSLIIRRGARYMLVSRGSAALEAIAAAVVVLALLSATHVYLQSYPLTACVVSAGVGIVVWNIARKLHALYSAPLIDRRFFRQAYDSHQIIAELTESLRTTTGMDHLLEMVATRVQAGLQTENVTIFLRDEATGDYRIAYSCDYNEADGRVIKSERQSLLPHYAEVVKRLSDNGKPLDVEQYVAEGRQVSDGKKATDIEKEDEMEVLKELKSSSLFPLSSKDEMLGIISLGPRLGDLPYSREDEQMLMSVAGPAALAIENAILVGQMIVEAGLRQELEAENEIRAKELEEARQLQLSMLPKSVPQLPHLEIEAYMKPAAEVGGDYYDFHLGDDGTLTVAVGDATGHGLKAGTVVTAMKSLFRTFAAEPEIVPVLDRSSRVLKEMNLRSLFMGLTMIKLNGRRMKISSAGMPPALIYRAETGAVEEVMIKAMPLGSVTGYPYRERELILGCGDVVVLMSDGLPERFNRRGEMFDYSRTMETLARAAAMAPGEIIERLVDAGEAWAEGRPQDDDITFVALKVKL